METNSPAHPARRVLIGRIETLAIGQTDATLGFEGRLAAENGWSEAFAARVAVEYRRFLALIATGEEPLTPSDAVDQAWHLHLAYTRDYWQGLCRDIVGHAIHHEPTSGGPDQLERYRDCYARTLDRYRATFGEVPPIDIWPDPAERFAGRFVRVDMTRPPHPAGAIPTAIGAGVMAMMVIAGQHLVVAALLAVIAVVALCRSLGRFRHGDGDGFEWDFGGFDGSDGGDGGDGGCGSGCGGGCS
ncbi:MULTISPECIES: glycine-rich domain-containing protein [unclassified Sphingomonas]|uniref:glycine-rich domain-containing protein n=1 Tax=unclassified Sphingomonas TaxID=196159 RepID=UPI0006F764CF|nr:MULTISPECIES: hypothetical protein [unclassified Sphingomonas]KQM27394.1 hypothetical protein ASE58_10760 [Sphingomonas sp. Leaf9]KQM43731.1 hypothetical protein ASE57_10765 [Sphingomonas sp. Leaf11]